MTSLAVPRVSRQPYPVSCFLRDALPQFVDDSARSAHHDALVTLWWTAWWHVTNGAPCSVSVATRDLPSNFAMVALTFPYMQRRAYFPHVLDLHQAYAAMLLVVHEVLAGTASASGLRALALAAKAADAATIE